MSVFTAGVWFVWVTPLLPLLLGPDSPVPMTEEDASWMVASIELGCIISPFPATYFADRFGRKLSIFLCAPIFTISFLLTIFVKKFFYLCVARMLQGIALCIPYTVLPMYLGEIASVDVRGTVTSFFYIFWGLGCLFPFCVGPLLSYDSFTYISFGTTVLFVLCFIWQPESPYFYAMKENTEGLQKSLKRLRDSPTEESIKKEQEEIQHEVKKSLEEKATWYDLIATPADRKALFLIVITGSISFFSGQKAILSYSTDTFTRLGYTSYPSPDTITLGIGIVAFFGSSFSTFTSDKYGRRFLLIFSSVGCIISLATASAFFYIQTKTNIDVSSFMWVSPLAVMMYNLFVTAGLFPVCITYSSELFPTKTRGLAASICNTNYSFSAFIVLKTYFTVSQAMGGIYFIYLCYSVICVIGLVIFLLFAPETKGKTFLEIRKTLESS